MTVQCHIGLCSLVGTIIIDLYLDLKRMGPRGILVEALYYKPEGRGFISRQDSC
jgi:hypothetical protein